MKNVLASASRPYGATGFRTRVTRSSAAADAARTVPKDFLSILDFDAEQLDEALRLAAGSSTSVALAVAPRRRLPSPRCTSRCCSRSRRCARARRSRSPSANSAAT